jgi:hypothetical protein
MLPELPKALANASYRLDSLSQIENQRDLEQMPFVSF